MAPDLTTKIQLPGKSPVEVWDCLGQPEHLCAWFTEAAEVDLEQGLFCFWGRCTPGTPDRDACGVELVSAAAAALGVAPPAEYRLEFLWQLRDVQTNVVWSLVASEGGSQLQVTHSGLAKREDPQGSLHDFWIAALEQLRLYLLTGRRQQLLDYRSGPGSSIRLSLEVHGTPEQLFTYLIEPAQVSRLWDDKQVVIEPVVGGVYSYGWEQGGPRRILALEAPRLLSFSWLYPPETQETTVTWRIDEEGGISRLSLEHNGFDAASDDEGYRAGWFSFLITIKARVELGGAWERVRLQGVEHGTV